MCSGYGHVVWSIEILGVGDTLAWCSAETPQIPREWKYGSDESATEGEQVESCADYPVVHLSRA
jgi:hypothetical protein